MKHLSFICLILLSLFLCACERARQNTQSDFAPTETYGVKTAKVHSISESIIYKSGGAWSHYLANEGIMVENGAIKVLFDPFFVTGFGTYTELPIETKAALMMGMPPFNDIDAVFISHAHRDHFAPRDMIAFLKVHQTVQLIAPQQAIDMMQAEQSWVEALLPRIKAVQLDYADAPIEFKIGEIMVSAVRIAHAGWPAPHRIGVENILYRVTLAPNVTIMHMGDADPNPIHYDVYTQFWQAVPTQTAFPPYWMLTSEVGRAILDDMSIKTRIGVHVPVLIPEDLRLSGEDYFSNSGEMREIK